MQSMKAEQVRQMVAANNELRDFAIANNKTPVSGITPVIVRQQSGRYAVIFDTPIGDVKLKSARQSVRVFASIDAAMKTINYCGCNFAHVHSNILVEFDEE